MEVIGECVGEWVAVNGIRLWCSTSSGSSQGVDWGPRTGVMMGLANSRVGCDSESGGWLVSIVSVGGWCGCGFRSMRVCRW